jgi:sporulation protein YlmC with PRC-barrel domain
MDNKTYYKSLVGKKVLDKTMNRVGYILNIAFHSKDYEICWFNFKYDKGGYLMHIDELEIIEPRQLTLF